MTILEKPLSFLVHKAESGEYVQRWNLRAQGKGRKSKAKSELANVDSLNRHAGFNVGFTQIEKKKMLFISLVSQNMDQKVVYCMCMLRGLLKCLVSPGF